MSRTAEVLGVERSNLYRKMRAFGIAPSRRPDGEEEAAGLGRVAGIVDSDRRFAIIGAVFYA